MDSLKAWVKRYWIAVVAVSVAGAVGIILLIQSSIESNPAFVEAITLARADARVGAAIGEPLRFGSPRGHIRCSLVRRTCTIDTSVEVAGKTGRGILHVGGTRPSAEGWRLTNATLVVADGPSIDLVHSGAARSK